jgi:serine/threonine protein kinase
LRIVGGTKNADGWIWRMAESNQQAEDLFNQVLELSPEERPAFFAQLRVSDPSLAADIESLVSAYGDVGSLVASPAYQAAAELIADDQPELQKGHKVGRYEVVAPLGKGGMGEVYMARDLRLDRQVALKFLPARFTLHRDRLRRFIQEAKAASALNHPNIITIHEIGEDNGAHFIATEFIDGETLRERLADGPMSVAEALDVAVQISSALQAAHKAGIIHRDIKPENIMLRPDGYVKVLDFGLAKLTEASPGSQPPAADSLIATRAQTGTQPGLILGTINYMSPEQARGRPIDARTDVFSLGVVIYEMLAGHRPFAGETSLDVLISILEKEPPPLSGYANVPAELQQIISRAIRKDRDERYQAIGEMLGELKGLKDEVAFKVRLDGLQPAKAKAHAGAEPLAATRSNLEMATSANLNAATSAQVGRITSARRLLRFALPLVVIGLVLAIVWRPRQVPQSPTSESSISEPERQVRYSITVQKYRGGKRFEEPFRLRDDMNFEKDYRVRLTVDSAQRGFLYLLNEGPTPTGQTPSYNVLFPSDSASAELPGNHPVPIPTADWFQFDQQQGEEKIWLVWSAAPVPVLESVKRFANPKDMGEIKSAEQNAAVADFLKTRSPAKPIVERDAVKKETTVKATGDVLVHVVKLEHH